MATHTFTADLDSLVAETLTSPNGTRARAYLTPFNGAVTDGVDTIIGSAKLELDESDAFSVVAPEGSYMFTVRYYDPAIRQMREWSTHWFHLDADKDLSEVVADEAYFPAIPGLSIGTVVTGTPAQVTLFGGQLNFVIPNGGGELSLLPHPTFPGILLSQDPDEPPPNYAPEVTITSALAEDLDVTVAWTGTDADSDPLTYVVDWGDGSLDTSPATSPANHTYATGGTYTITVIVSDGTDTGSDTVDVIASPSLLSDYHQLALAHSSVVYFPGDDLAGPPVDAMGVATATTTTTYPTFGALGIGDGATAMDFDSTTDSVAFGQPAALNGLTDFTFMMLVQPDSNAATEYILSRDDATSLRSYTIRRNLQKFEMQTLEGATVTVSTTLNYPSGSIYHLAFRRTGGTLTIYVNGVSAGSGSSSLSLGADATPHVIGARVGSGIAIDGRIAGVAIFDTALSPAVIADFTTAAGL